MIAKCPAVTAYLLRASAKLLGAVCFALVLTKVAVAEVSKTVSGIYALTKAREPIPNAILSHPDIEGIVVRGSWRDVEPRRGEYDWEYFDEQMARVAQAGKRISLVITSGGLATPDWVLQSSQTFRFVDRNRFHKTAGQQVSIPLFWDPAFLEEKKRLISAMGARYSRQSALLLVSAQCANATTDDWNIPASPEDADQWRSLGFSEEKMLRACQEILDVTMSAFPGQLVRMSFGRIPSTLASRPDGLAQEIVKYANDRYPGRLIVMRHNLSAKTPLADDGRNLHGWALIRDHTGQTAAQFLWPASDIQSCRLDSGQSPCIAQDMFDRAVLAAFSYRFLFVEAYTADLLNQALTSGIRNLAKGLAESGLASKAASVSAATGKHRGLLIKREEGRGRPDSRKEGMVHRGERYGAGEQKPPLQDIDHLSFVGQHGGKEIRYSIYLPPGYEESGKRYPVIYWLHGKGGDERRSTHVARYLAQSVAQGNLADAIMIFPNGGEISFYTDAADGTWPIETMILEDLIPYIEANYRVIPEKRGRFLMGFSMGGFGALKFAAKYPDRFAAVVAYGAPRLDKSFGMGGVDAEIFSKVFAGDTARFEENTPSFLFKKNREKIINERLKIRIVAGGEDGTRHSVQKLHEILEGLGIAHEYEILPGVRHVVSQYYEAESGKGFAAFSGIAPGAKSFQ